MARRIAASLLASCAVLVAGPGSAQELPEEGGDPKEQAAPTREQVEELERRVQELEASQAANEEATRSIIRDAVSTLGSRINEFVVFGGAIEVLTGWGQSFEGPSEEVIRLNTLEFDFEILVTDWARAGVVIEYDDGTDTLFPTTEDFEVSVDRINVDTATVTLGDTLRFPAFGSFGRMVVPFGISTGDPVADVVTLEDPLTIEIFETKHDAIFLGAEFPTPPVTPPTPIPAPARVRPLVLAPLIGAAARGLGYRPRPPPPPTQTFVTAPQQLPPVNAGIYFFHGDTHDGSPRGNWEPADHIGATLGYQTKGQCRPFGQLAAPKEVPMSWLHLFCPWSIEYDVDFNSSVFDSQFLKAEYQSFLGQIGFVPGMAASVKASLGPVGVVAEWNGAIEHATFDDGLGTPTRIRPSAWQVSLAYQFDWNPSVPAIGAQGTYVAFGYSESQQLAGVVPVGGVAGDRVGSVPRRRILVSAGEWVLEGVRVAVEYAHIVDYSKQAGGTGKSANGVFSMLTFEW